MPKGLNITYKPLDEDHVWAIMTWAEQDVGGGHLTVEVVVRNMKAAPKPPEQLESRVGCVPVAPWDEDRQRLVSFREARRHYALI